MVIIMQNKTNSKSIKRQQQQQQYSVYDNASTTLTMKPENRYSYYNKNNLYRSSSTFTNINNNRIKESSSTILFTNSNKMKQNYYHYNNNPHHNNQNNHYHHNHHYQNHYNNGSNYQSSNGNNRYDNYYTNDNKIQSKSSYDLQPASTIKLSPVISTPLITSPPPPPPPITKPTVSSTNILNNNKLNKQNNLQRNDSQCSINSTITSSTTTLLYNYKITNHLSTVDENEINNNNVLNDNMSTTTLTTKSNENLNKPVHETISNCTLNNDDSYNSEMNETSDACHGKRDYYSRLINEMERLYPEIKWPLHNTWSFWYIKNDRLKKDWKDNLIKLTDVSYIEDFWAIFNYLVTPSTLETGADLALFKAGVEPMWEDPENITGGRWLLTFSSQSRKVNELDEIWLNTILALIGDNFCGVSNKDDLNLIQNENNSDSDHICDNITGLCVQNRPKIDKISLWTKNYKNEALTRYIGRKWKDNVHINQMITFEPHDSQLTKGSSSKLIYKE